MNRHERQQASLSGRVLSLARRLAMPLTNARQIEKLRRRVDALEEGQRAMAALTPGLAESLVEIADMSTAWSANYIKYVDEAYVSENERHHRPMFTLVEELARRASPQRPPRLVEAGMGLGTMCIALSRRNYEVTGFDQDALQVARAKHLSNKLGGFARYLCLDIFDLDLLQPDCFDVCFSQGTLEHFGPADLARALHLQLRLAPYVVFSVPSVDWPGKEIGNERRLTRDEWRLAIRAASLEPISVEYYGKEYYGKAKAHVLAAVAMPSVTPG